MVRQLSLRISRIGEVVIYLIYAFITGIPITLVTTKNSRKKRIFSEMMNMLLMVMFIPVFVAGAYMVLNVEVIYHVDSAVIAFIDDLLYENTVFYVAVMWIIPILLGVFLHELAHANACRACKGGRVYEYGFLMGLIPGFYTAIDESGISGPGARFKKIQVMLAGVEANILFAGISLILSCLIFNLNEIFIHWADINITLCLFNLLFFDKLDGQRAIALILGLDVLNDDFIRAKNVVRSRRMKKELLKKGPVGLMKIIACYAFEVFSFMYPLVIIMNILIIGGLFICF